MEKYIEKLLKIIDFSDGFYIEAGANDGISQSYTYELEKKGWKGILVEPSLASFNECIKNRSKDNHFFNCALVNSEELTEISGDFNGSLISSINAQRYKGYNNNSDNRNILTKVKSFTLNYILDKLNIENIDLLSLDVEGYELEVLQGLNLEKYKPKYILIEVYDKQKKDIFKMMEDNNYKLISNLTGYNLLDFPNWDGTCNDYLFKINL
jgi:FkbM family methyltransferase